MSTQYTWSHTDNRDGEEVSEGDYVVTSNGMRLTCNQGIDLPADATEDDYATAIGAKMESDQVFPDVWLVSDHGNINLCILVPLK